MTPAFKVMHVRYRPNISDTCTVSDDEFNASGLVDAPGAIGHERKQIVERVKAARSCAATMTRLSKTRANSQASGIANLLSLRSQRKCPCGRT